MNLETLTLFFYWCTLINFCLLFITGLMLMLARDFVCGLHCKIFNLSKEQICLANYQFMAVFKIFFFIFNLVPYIALKLMGN